MAGSDTRQLILQVDASVAVAQRQLRSLSASVEAETKGIEGSLGRIDTAHQRLGVSVGNARNSLLEFGHVGRAAADQIATGTPLTQILTQHMAQLGQAVGEAGGAFGKFGAFLGGPWGIAITLATVVLAKFAFGAKEGEKSVDDLLKKMRQNADQAIKTAEANDIWQHSIEGLTEASKKLREEQEKELKTAIQLEQDALNKSQGALAEVERKRNATVAELRRAETELTKAKSRFTGVSGSDDPTASAEATSRVAAAATNVQNLKAQLATLNADVARGQASVRGAQAPIAERNVDEKLNKAEAATDNYTRALGRLRVELQKGKIDQAGFESGLETAARIRDAAIEAAKEADRKAKAPAHQFGREIDIGRAREIVQSIGGTVTSGQRSTAEQQYLYDHVRTAANPVARPGTSAHERGNALDVAFGKGITVESLRKAFAEEGVRLTKVLKETGHFHIEFSTAGADKLARKNETEAKKALHNVGSFDQESDRADKELLVAQREIVKDTSLRAEYARQEALTDQKKADDAVKQKVLEGDLTKAQASLLIGKQQQVADQRIANINAVEADRLAQESNRRGEIIAVSEVDHLKAGELLAVTLAERRDIQLKIVDAMTQIEINAQQEIIDSKTASDAQKEIARLLIQRAKLQNADAHVAINRQTQSPGQAYIQNLKDADKRIGEDFESIGAKGLNALNSGLVDAITGTRKLGDVFHDISKQIIADLLQIAVRKAIIEPLANALFGGKSGGTGGGIGGLFASLGGLFGGAKGVGPATVSKLNAGPVFTGGSLAGVSASLPRFASGGTIDIGGHGGTDQNLLSLNGSPLALVGQGEKLIVVPRERSASIRPGMSGGIGGGNTTVIMNGVITNDQFWSELDRRSHVSIAVAAQAGAQGGQNMIAQKQARMIP